MHHIELLMHAYGINIHMLHCSQCEAQLLRIMLLQFQLLVMYISGQVFQLILKVAEHVNMYSEISNYGQKLANGRLLF